MRSFFRIYTLSVLVICFAALAALQTAAQTTPVPQTDPVTEFEVNGLKVILKRRDSAPTFAGGLFFRGGVRNQTADKAGIENFALATATEGGQKFSRQQVRRELSRTGGSLGGASSRDYGVISFVSTRESFDRIWDVFTDTAISPTFAAADVERVRQQIISGLRETETRPDGALIAAQDRMLYSGHPYSVDPMGSIRTIGSITAADLKKYHAGMMQTSRMLLVIVGDITPDELKQKVTASFGKLAVGTYKNEPLPALDFSKGTVDVTPRDVQTNYVQGVFAAPSLSDPDYYAMKVAMTILQQLVFDEVRVKRQLSYAPNAEMSNNAANTAFIYVTATDVDQSVRVMLEQIEMMRTRTTSDEFINGMAGQFLTHYYLDQQTNAAQAKEIAQYELIGGGWRNSSDFLKKMREVKPADIRRVAEKYMKNIRFVVVGNPESVNKEVLLSSAK